MQRPGIKRFLVLDSFHKYPIYRTPCPLPSCSEVLHDNTLAALTSAADITAGQCEMHLLYHKSIGDLGDLPNRPPLPSDHAKAPEFPSRLPSPTLPAGRLNDFQAQLQARAKLRMLEEQGMTKPQLVDQYCRLILCKDLTTRLPSLPTTTSPGRSLRRCSQNVD